MILKYFKNFLSLNTGNNTKPNDLATCSSKTIKEFITNSQDVQITLNNFVSNSKLEPVYISLGENCSSAWYLKQVGLKRASYPFDWLFSSPEIIIDCISDGFKKYLDKSLVEPKANNISAGHKYYHSNFFNHRNPLKSEKDYSYYERCCQRFLHNLQSQAPTHYLITLINEPTKRPGWANGFSRNFPMPVNHNYKSIMPLFNKLKSINKNSRFIVVEHYTNSDRHAKANQVNPDIMYIKFNAFGSNTGVLYQDNLDDFCFKLIMTGLHKSHNNGIYSSVDSA